MLVDLTCVTNVHRLKSVQKPLIDIDRKRYIGLISICGESDFSVKSDLERELVLR